MKEVIIMPRKSSTKWPHVFALLLISLLTSFAEAAEVVVVVASGIGPTPKDAARDALRSAVEQAVGQLVDAETMVSNEEIIADKILTYSGGFVESMEIVSPPAKQGDGLFSISIKAHVKKTQLTEKLNAESVSTIAVSGNSLFSEMLTKQNRLDDGISILKKDFEGAPFKLITAETAGKSDGRPDVQIKASGQVSVNVVAKIEMAAYESWVKRLIEKFDAIASSKRKVVLTATGRIWDRGDTSQGVWQFPEDFMNFSKEEMRLLIVDRVSPDGRILSCNMYIFDEEISSELSKLFDKHIIKEIYIGATMQSESSSLVGGGQEQLQYTGNSRLVILCDSYDERTVYSIMPYWSYAANFNYSTDGQICVSWNNERTQKKVNVDLGSYDSEQLSAVTEIECSISGGEEE